MPIEFPCPQCGRTLRTPDGSAGKRAKCPSCEMVTSIPASSAPSAPAGGGNPFGGSSGPGQGGNPFGDSGSQAESNPFADSTSRANAGGFDDPLNPYASPSTVDDRVATSGGELQRRKIDFGEAISVSWDIFSNNFGMMLVAGLLFIIIALGWNLFSSIAVALLQGALGVAMGNGPFGPGPVGGNQGLMNNIPALMVYIAIQIVATVINMAVYAWLQCGMLRFTLAAARGRPPEINLLFSSGNYVLRMVGFSLLTTLIIYGLALIGAIPGFIAQDFTVGMIGAGILGFIAAISLFLFMFTPMFIVDRNEGVFDAMRSSWYYMSNNFLTVFAVLLVIGFVLIFVVLFTCGLGYLGAVPFFILLTSVMYLMATGQMVRR